MPPAGSQPVIPSFGAEPTAAAAPATAGVNMLGDLLFGSRSISFFTTRAGGTINTLNLSSTSITNASVADNNSAVPADRFYFRYNFYKDSLSVTGISEQTVPGPNGFPSAVSQTRFYDVHQYTFGGEKTFLDGLASVEVRVPFRTTLASQFTWSAADVTGVRGVNRDTGLTEFTTQETPANTLGHYDTEFGNMDVILKGVLCRTPHFVLSGGLSAGLPTGRSTNMIITDVGAPSTDPNITFLHDREVFIRNETFTLTPFLAFLANPTKRWFTQGFLSFELPLNSSQISYTDRFFLNQPGSVPSPGAIPTPFTVEESIHEQPLMHVDIGTGYWLRKDPCALISGIVPTIELHYTTTLQSAQIIQLPGDTNSTMLNPADPRGPQIPQPGPVVGNQRNRVDILDLTVGTTFVFGDNVTFATGVAAPLRGHDDRTFDWELTFQLNYYFGGPRRAPAIIGAR
jgi:hypothetical protein